MSIVGALAESVTHPTFKFINFILHRKLRFHPSGTVTFNMRLPKSTVTKHPEFYNLQFGLLIYLD
jgi:hypothetical protein